MDALAHRPAPHPIPNSKITHEWLRLLDCSPGPAASIIFDAAETGLLS